MSKTNYTIRQIEKSGTSRVNICGECQIQRVSTLKKLNSCLLLFFENYVWQQKYGAIMPPSRCPTPARGRDLSGVVQQSNGVVGWTKYGLVPATRFATKNKPAA